MGEAEETYRKVQQARDICKSSLTKQEAKAKLEQAGLWWEWLREARPYMDLPE